MNRRLGIVPEPKTVLLFLIAIAVVVPISLGGQLPFIASAAAPPAPMRAIPNTDVNPFGANTFLQWEAEDWKVEKTLQMAHDAGLGWIKQHFPWEDIELKKSVYWDDRLNKSTWDKYDRIVALAEKYHLKIIARLDRPPDWARHNSSVPEAPPDTFQDYAVFVQAVVQRYKGKIKYYQLWNEPNIWPEWGDRTIDPADYVKLLRAGYEAAKRADPDAYILSAPLAQTYENSPRAMADLAYLEGLYQNGGKDYFDILFANAYGFSLPPDSPPDAKTLNFQRVLLLRDIMVRYGDAQKPVWFNEFGWTAPPADFPPDKLVWGQVTEQQQAQYTVAAIDKARTEWPWAGVFCIWYFRQDGHIPSDRADYYFRMVDAGFTPRPLYNAVKARAAISNGVAIAGDYQQTNPALATDGDWQSKRDPRANGESLLVSKSPGANATITFRGTDITLLVRKGPDAGTLNVSLDGTEVGSLPRDKQGRTYIDLYSPTEQWQAAIQVATGLGNGEHKLRLVVRAERNAESQDNLVGIDGFSVRDNRSLPWEKIITGVAAVVIFLALISRWRRRPIAGAL